MNDQLQKAIDGFNENMKPINELGKDIARTVDQGVQHSKAALGKAKTFIEEQAADTEKFIASVPRAGDYLKDSVLEIGKPDTPLSEEGKKTKELITQIQQEEAKKVTPEQAIQNTEKALAKLGANFGSLTDVVLTKENRKAWQATDPEVKKFYEETFPKLHVSEQREIAKNIALLEQADTALGNSQDLQGGAYALAKVIHDRTHNIKDTSGIVAQVGSNVMGRVGQAFSEGFTEFSAAWSSQEGHIGQKLVAGVQAGFGKFVSTMSHSPANYAEDILVDRTAQVMSDAAKLGYQPNFSQFIGTVATQSAADTLKETVKLEIDVASVQTRLGEHNTQIAQKNKGSQQATNPKPSAETVAQQQASHAKTPIAAGQSVQPNTPIQPTPTPSSLDLDAKTISI